MPLHAGYLIRGIRPKTHCVPRCRSFQLQLAFFCANNFTRTCHTYHHYIFAMYSIPRQAMRSPTPPGHSNANLNLDPLLFNDNEYFSFSDYYYPEYSSLNIPHPDLFTPFSDNYTFDSLPFQVPAPYEPVIRTNPIERGCNLPQHAPALTLPGPSEIADFQTASNPGPERSQQGLEPKSHTRTKKKKPPGNTESNSPESTDSPGSSSSRDSQKRKLEVMTGSFPTAPDNQPLEKKKKAYDEKTRKKVALMRKVKPCKRCVIQKIGVC